MNILQINTIDNKGGAALTSYQLKQELEKRGHTTSMFVKRKYSNDKNVFSIKKNQAPSQRLSKLSKKIIKKDLPSYIKNKRNFFFVNNIDSFNILKSTRILKTKEFKNADIVHCNNLHGKYFNLKLLEKISKIKPIIWSLHDMWAITGDCYWGGEMYGETCIKWQKGCKHCPYLKSNQKIFWNKPSYLWKKKQEIYKNSKLNIVVPSMWLKKRVEKSMLKNKNITVINYGINLSKFKKQDKKTVRKKLKLPLGKKIIMFSAHGGKNNKQKGWKYVEKIIDYYKKDKDILFLCIGNKSTNGNQNTSKIKYIEYISDKSVLAQYYSASNIFLLPSLVESFGIVILEAMACGTLVVGFPVGAMEELGLHKQYGYIAKYKDTKDLINGIEYILSLNKKEKKDMEKRSIERVKNNFSLEKMTNKYISLYRQALSEYE